MGYIKLVKSGDLVQVYKYQKDYVYRPPRKTNKRKRISKKEAHIRAFNQYRLGRSIQRARKGFFLLVNANLQRDTPPTFATFTFNEDIEIEMGYRATQVFFKELRKRFGDHIRYISVPEWQKGGRLHFHALIWGLQPRIVFDEVPFYYRKKLRRKRFEQFSQFCAIHGYEPSDARGTRELQRLWARGYVDLLGATSSGAGIAGYMAKYLVKGLADVRLANSRGYSASRNIHRPTTYGLNGLDEDVFFLKEEFGGKDLELQKTSSYDTLYLGSCIHETLKIS